MRFPKYNIIYLSSDMQLDRSLYLIIPIIIHLQFSSMVKLIHFHNKSSLHFHKLKLLEVYGIIVS